MSITTQPTVNVLNGSLACAFNDGRPTGSNELIPSIPGNALENPTFDVVESPPFGVSFNGALYFDGNWGHFGQLYVSNFSFEVSTNNFFLANFPGFKDLGGGELGDQKKVLKIFGTGTNFPDNLGDKANRDNSRTAGNIPLVGMSETSPAGAFPDSGSWCRSEWWQGVSVPDGATTVKFGAYVRVAEDDDFRARNCGGVYLKTNGAVQAIIDAIVVKRDEDTINLVTGGMAAGLNSIQQWSGISETKGGDPLKYSLRWNDPMEVNSIDYVNTSNHRQFRKIEKEITLNGDTDTLGIGLFFGENQANLDESGTPTGSIQFYNPFVVFS